VGPNVAISFIPPIPVGIKVQNPEPFLLQRQADAKNPGLSQEAVDEPSSSTFKVPVGLAPDGRPVMARQAREGLEYRCPGCAGPLLLKRGAVRAPHFAHKTTLGCSPETALHQGVKNWICLVLQKRLARKRAPDPKLRVPCEGPRWRREQRLGDPCPGKAWLRVSELAFDEVAEERMTPDGLRPDVLLLHQGAPVLAIEVLVTHAVDAAKAARTSCPWVELNALQVLSRPSVWEPHRQSHPWSGVCPNCLWREQSCLSDPSEHLSPGEYVAELAAATFEDNFSRWLHSKAGRTKPRLAWRCPWCRKSNRLPMAREGVVGAARSSALGPPILPEVILTVDGRLPISITFSFPANPDRPMAIIPLPDRGFPALRATPDPRHPLRLTLNGTNRTLDFICARCCRDCVGSLPSPLDPVPYWETLTTTWGFQSSRISARTR